MKVHAAEEAMINAAAGKEEVVGFGGGARTAFYSTRSTSASSKLIQRFKCPRHDFIWAETGQIYQMGWI